MKKLLIGLAVVIGLGAVAAGLGSSTETAPTQKAEPSSNRTAKVTVPLATSGPDTSYKAGDSARVSKNRVTFAAGPVDGTCAPLDDTESPQKWCRGGSQMYRMDAKVLLKGGASVDCSQNNETFWGGAGKQNLAIPCDEDIDVDKVESVELLGSTP